MAYSIRKAHLDELTDIFMMAYDEWSEGKTPEEYLNSCYQSPKYRQGQWWVLDSSDGILCSAIIYNIKDSTWGLGSLATPPCHRKKGYASRLVSQLCCKLEKFSETTAIFLFSDINPQFYKKQHFTILPEQFQNYKSSICMVRSRNPEAIWSDSHFTSLEYF